ncbi:MAG TPA: DUF512 domain-containing protein [Negativicutes bacterium]|nr:DUF512 domain-containing protein [Negativicutes bacterium]
MKPAPFSLLLEAASRDNILVLTTNCSTACIFCSHHQNPADINAYYVEELRRDEIDTLIGFLDGKGKITIGESATRICEGEPFLREDLIDILDSIRVKYPKVQIQITTSGIHLDRDMLSELSRIDNIELNLSINSSSPEGRKKLYRGKEHRSAVEAVKLIRDYGIGFSGSIVAMPHLVGWEDIRQTILFLNENGASAIRLFMPGYTRYTKGLLPPENIRDSLLEFSCEMGGKLGIPLIVEPSGIKDVNAVVQGVLPGSPACRAGIARGDRIIKLNGKEPVSRVDAYYMAQRSENPELEVLRNGKIIKMVIDKQAASTSGMVFNYDIHPDTILDIEKSILRNRGKSFLVLTSELAYEIIKACVQRNFGVETEAVKNLCFGGNIMCAGLLTIGDIEAHMDARQKPVEVLLLPEIMFDTAGRDLLGRHFKELEESLGIKVEVV